MTFNFRTNFSGILGLSILVMCASLYLQYGMHLEPCPLCIMQRLCLLMILICSGMVVMNPQYAKLRSFWVGLAIMILAGCYFAFRQLYLQSLPPHSAPPCLPSLQLLATYYPWFVMVKALFLGSGSCAVVEFKLLGLSLAFWSAVYFIIVAVLASYAWRQLRS